MAADKAPAWASLVFSSEELEVEVVIAKRISYSTGIVVLAVGVALRGSRNYQVQVEETQTNTDGKNEESASEACKRQKL